MDFNILAASALGFLASYVPAIFKKQQAIPFVVDVPNPPPVLPRGDKVPVPEPVYPSEVTLEGSETLSADSTKEITSSSTVFDSNNFTYTSMTGGGKFTEFVRASVRPTVTYLFFFLYIGLKIAAFQHAVWTDDVPALDAINSIWNTSTDTLFVAIISFWFGNRAWTHFQKK